MDGPLLMTFKLFSGFEDHVEVATNICMQVLWEEFILISLGQFLDVELVCLMVSLCLSL